MTMTNTRSNLRAHVKSVPSAPSAPLDPITMPVVGGAAPLGPPDAMAPPPVPGASYSYGDPPTVPYGGQQG